jgi:hypothetical protein
MELQNRDLQNYLASGNDSPIKRYLRGEDNNPAVTINVHYSASHGSDAAVMEEISDHLANGVPFALQSGKSSLVVFIPSKLTAYWFGSSEPNQFIYANQQAFIDGVKLQYLTHKEFLNSEALLEISNFIMWPKLISR